MKRRFIIRPLADIDLAEHYLFLRRRSIQVAERFLAAIDGALDTIRKDPQSGCRLQLPDRDHWNLRFFRPKDFLKYVVIFRITDEAIYVVRILHGAQDWERAVRES